MSLTTSRARRSRRWCSTKCVACWTCAIKSPALATAGAATQDIAVLTGATFITEQLGLSFDAITEDMLGKAAHLGPRSARR